MIQFCVCQGFREALYCFVKGGSGGHSRAVALHLEGAKALVSWCHCEGLSWGEDEGQGWPGCDVSGVNDITRDATTRGW